MPFPTTVLCDVDGVIWLARQPLPGAVEAIRRIREVGHAVEFVTNNSYSTLVSQERGLAEIGIEARDCVVTASMAAASLVGPHSQVVIGGGPGIYDAVMRRGAHVVPIEDCMAADPKDLSRKITDVIIGFHRDFDYARLALYSSLVRNGARLIGTNEDATYPTPEGVIPGGGSILAAVATASGSAPIVAGKPHQTMATLLQDRLGATRAHHTWMVGDRMSTDGLFAQRLGCRFAHIRSDVTEVGGSVTPSHTFYSLADFADALLGGAFE